MSLTRQKQNLLEQPVVFMKLFVVVLFSSTSERKCGDRKQTHFYFRCKRQLWLLVATLLITKHMLCWTQIRLQRDFLYKLRENCQYLSFYSFLLRRQQALVIKQQKSTEELHFKPFATSANVQGKTNFTAVEGILTYSECCWKYLKLQSIPSKKCIN